MKSVGPGNKGIPFGYVRNDFGRCVKAAAEAEANVNLFALGEYLTWTEYLKIWCDSQNVPYGGYDEVGYEEFCTLLPGGLGHEFSQNVLFAWEFGYDGSDPSATLPKDVSSSDYCSLGGVVC